MPPGATFKLDAREFTRTLNTYRQLSKRDPATIVNTKLFYIARRATVETPKANAAKIKRELGRMVTTGKQAGTMRLRKVRRGSAQVPLAALIINKRLGPGAGLHGAEMTEAIRKFIASRLRSIAFLKSGWLPAIKKLEPLAAAIGGRQPRQDRTARQFGQPKGRAVPARSNLWSVSGMIENMASENKDNRNALVRYGGPALQKAFQAEEASMLEYIERKMKQTAQRAGVAVR